MPDDSGITLAEAKTQLAKWMTADADLATNGQAYVQDIGGERHSKTRVDGETIRKNIEFWNTQVRRLSGSSGIRVFGVIPPA